MGRVTPSSLAHAAGLARHRPDALERLRGAALTSAGHDHMCVAAGLGAVGRAQVLDSCGTAEAFVRTVPTLDDKAVGRAVQAGLNAGWNTVPGTYALLAGQLLGLMLERVLALLGAAADALAALDAAAQATPAGPLRVVQEGFDTPASIRGVGPTASPAALWSAALDCLSDGAARITGAMGAIAGPAAELVLSGGWARCAGLRRRREALVPSVRWPAVTEAGARGAAMFGGCAAGLFAGPRDFPVPADRL